MLRKLKIFPLVWLQRDNKKRSPISLQFDFLNLYRFTVVIRR